MAKNLQIAAVNEGKAAFDEGDDGIAQRRCPPGLGVDARRAVERGGDLAIGRTAVAQVERAEHKVEPGKPVGGERPATRQRTRRATEQTAMEAQQAGDAGEEILVERDDCCERPARRRVAQPQPMLSGCIGDNDMASVDPGQIGVQRAERARIDRGGGRKSLRCGVQDDRDGGQFGAPDHRL